MMQSYFGTATLAPHLFIGESQGSKGFSRLAKLQTMAGEMASVEFSNGRDFRKHSIEAQRFRRDLSD